MRRFTLFLLLATAAAPSLAQDGERGRRHNRDADSEQQSERRTPRAERAATQESQSEQRRQGAGRSDRAEPNEQGTTERIRERILERRQSASTDNDAGNAVRNWRRRDNGTADGSGGSTLRPRERVVRTIPETQPSERALRRGGIAREFDGRPRRDYRDGNYRRWSRDWHRDGRYDWRRWRDRHRSLFRLGFYYDPFGWNYRRWSIGSFLWPSYYGSNFWLNDPWQYRLPPAYGPYRWVRYWDDALLVNIYTGEVVEVMHNFFW